MVSMGAVGRYRGAGAAVGLGLVLSGCASGAPVGAPGPEPCFDPPGRLVAHVNDDEYPDAVTGTGGTGDELRIAFGEESGFGEPRTPRDLVGFMDRDEDHVRAAVADFDGDGWLDLVITASERIGGDDPVPSAVNELRTGPISERGRGQETHGFPEEQVTALRVVDYDGNDRPDLAFYQYDGDGSYVVQGHQGGRGEGLSPQVEHYYVDVADSEPEGNLPPPLGLEGFYPTCGV